MGRMEHEAEGMEKINGSALRGKYSNSQTAQRDIPASEK